MFSVEKTVAEKVSQTESRAKVELTNAQVHEALEDAGVLNGKPVIVEFDLGIFDPEAVGAYSDLFTEEVRALKKHDASAYVLLKGDPRLVQRAMAKSQSAGLFLFEVPQSLKDAARVNAFAPEVTGARLGMANVPVQQLKQSVPAFQAMLELAVASGRIDPRRIPDGYLNAYSTLAGARLTAQTLGDILEGLANLATFRQYSIKPVLEKIGDYLRILNMRIRMLAQSA